MALLATFATNGRSSTPNTVSSKLTSVVPFCFDNDFSDEKRGVSKNEEETVDHVVDIPKIRGVQLPPRSNQQTNLLQ